MKNLFLSLPRHRNSCRNSRGGFTLVEMLVTVAIIAVLGAVSFTAYLSAINSAHRAQCLSNMRQIAIGVTAYTGDNGMSYPTGAFPSAWDVQISGYLGNIPTTAANPVLKCPSDPRPLIISANLFARSYTFNGMNAPPPDDGGYGLEYDDYSRKTTQVSNPSNTIMLSEWWSGDATANYQYGAGYNRLQVAAGATFPQLAGGNCYHGTTSNFVFADGHAESLVPNATVEPISMWQAVRQEQ